MTSWRLPEQSRAGFSPPSCWMGGEVADPRVPAFPLPRLAEGATVTVGSFDGVHLGHQAVLGEIDRRAHAAGRASLLVTFDPHPLEVVNPEAAPPLLTTGPERLE